MATLSVIILIENSALTIIKMIDSIVHQSRQADEILLFDNGSTDGSLECVNDEITKYPGITVFKSSKKCDMTEAMNNAVRMISGEYCVFVNAAGWVLPGYFENAMDMVSKYPDTGIVCADFCIYETKKSYADEPDRLWAETPTFFSPDQLSTRMAGRGIVDRGIIYKSKMLLDNDNFPLELKWYSEWFIAQVIAFRKGCIYFPYAVYADNSGVRASRLGHINTSEQREIIATMIRLLKSGHYSDVLPHFVKSGVMSEFSLDAVKVVMHTPEFWDSTSMQLITHPLHYWNNHLIQLRKNFQRMAIERSVYAIVKECDTMIDSGHGDESEIKITNLISQFPKFPDGYRLMSRLMLEKKKFTHALESCKSWISLEPMNVQAKILEGFILFNLKEYQAAEKSFQDVLVIDESNLDALINLAELSMHFKRGTDAIGYLHRAQKIYPGNREISDLINSYKNELGILI